MSDLLELLDSELLALVALFDDFPSNTVRHLALLPARPEPPSVLVVVPELSSTLDVLARHVRSRTLPHGVEASPHCVHGVLRELFILSELSPSDETRPCWSLRLLSKGFRSSLSLFGDDVVRVGLTWRVQLDS